MILPGRGVKPKLSVEDERIVEMVKKSLEVRSELAQTGRSA